MHSEWNVQDAKNRFSEVVEQALHHGPQMITRRGKETAVLVSVEAFRQLAGAQGNLAEFFQQSPLRGIEIERSKEIGRDIEL